MKRKGIVIAIGVLLISIFLIGGFGSAKPPTAQAETIKIGGLAGLTGIISTYGQPGVYGWTLAVEEINTAGGLLGGRQIELIVEDHECSGDRTATVVKRLVERNKVKAILIDCMSPVGIAASTMCERLEVPNMSGASWAAELTEPTRPWTFAYIWNPSEATASYLAKAHELGFTRCGQFAANNAWGRGVAESVAVACAKYQIEYPGAIYIDEGAVDATIQVAKLKKQNPHFIIITTYDPESAAFLRARAAADWYVPTFWDAGIIPKAEKLSGIRIGDKCDEMGYFLQDLSRPKVKALYDTAVKKWGKFGTGIHTFWECYDTMKMVAWAIEKAGSDDPKAIRDALETIKDWQALSGPPRTTVSFSPTNHRAMNRHMAVWMKYKNGEWFSTD